MAAAGEKCQPILNQFLGPTFQPQMNTDALLATAASRAETK
jgi:hypothetical protein